MQNKLKLKNSTSRNNKKPTNFGSKEQIAQLELAIKTAQSHIDGIKNVHIPELDTNDKADAARIKKYEDLIKSYEEGIAKAEEVIAELKSKDSLGESIDYTDERYLLKPYWYYTIHGVAPGSVPKVDIWGSFEADNGTYFATKNAIPTKDLREFEIIEKQPNIEDIPEKVRINIQNWLEEPLGESKEIDTTMNDMEKDLRTYCDLLKKDLRAHYPNSEDTFDFKKGDKYYKIIELSPYELVHAFVDFDGNVYKPAGWRAPAKGVRATLKDIVDGKIKVDFAGGYLYKSPKWYAESLNESTNPTSAILRDIAKAKSKLKGKKPTENFGQDEVRKLRDKYFDYRYGQFSSAYSLIDDFDDWCANYTGMNESQIESSTQDAKSFKIYIMTNYGKSYLNTIKAKSKEAAVAFWKKWHDEYADKNIVAEIALTESFAQEEELETLPGVYMAYESGENTYTLNTSWVSTPRQANSIYLKVRDAAEKKYGDRLESLKYVRDEWRDNYREIHCVLEIKLKDAEPIKEDFTYMNGDKVKVFYDFEQAKKEAERLGLKESEYGDKWGTKYSYCLWNKTGNKDDNEEIYAIYTFENGKPRALTDAEIEDVNTKFDLDLEPKNESLKEDLSQDQQKDFGLGTLVNDLIRDELEAVDGYNSAIVTFETEGKGEFTDVFRDIIAEENKHIGQLQAILGEINPTTTTDIEQGQQEGQRQIDGTEEDSRVTLDTEKGVAEIWKLDRVEDMKDKEEN